MKGALDGIRVLDLTVAWSGPFATMLVGDMGAEVIRVESLHHYPTSTKGVRKPPRSMVARLGNVNRGYPDLDPGDDPWNRNALYNAHARNKRSMTVDLRRPEGRDIFLRLVERSDGLFENNTVGTLEKLGIGPDVLLATNPSLIVVRMPPLGSDGPLAHFTGFAPQFEALTGIIAAQGYADTDVTSVVTSFFMDAASGPAAASAFLMALHARRRSGRGAVVEVPQAENLLHSVGDLVAEAMLSGDPPRRGNRDRSFAPQGVYPCAGDDQWVALTVTSDDEWRALRKVVASEALDEPGLSDVRTRRARHDEIDAVLAAWSRSLDKREAAARLQAAGVPAGPVMDEADAYADPHLRERGFFVELTHVAAGTHAHPGALFAMSATPPVIGRAAPALGQDNDYVYRDVLGCTDDDIERLTADGHIGDRYVFEDAAPPTRG